jgi:ABC-2 type transport system permease protein
VRLVHTAWAFLVRDFQVEASYRLSFLLQFFGLFVNTLMWFFLSGFIDAVSGGGGSMRAQTGTASFFPWLLTGITVQRFLDVSLSSYASQIRSEQTLGTLEAMLVTPSRLWHLMLSSSVWSFTFAGLQAALYLLFGVVIFGIDLEVGNLFGGLLAILLTIAAFSGIGILSAAFVLYFKRGNPINFVIGSTTMLFGNVIIPFRSLPDEIAWIAPLTPVFYATSAVRGALLHARSFAELLPDLLALTGFAALLLPAGLVGARYAVRRAKQEGSLVQY